MSIQKQVFRAAERRILASIAEALIPHGGRFELGAADVDLPSVLETELADLEPGFCNQIRWLLRSWDWAHALRPPFRRFSELSLQERIERVRAAYHSRHILPRLTVEGLKQLCGFAFAATDAFVKAVQAEARCINPEPPREGVQLHPLQFPEIQGNLELTCDVCVIGSGAGGAVIAAECAQAGLRVVVVEEGGYHTSAEFASSPPFRRMLRMYRDHGAIVAFGRPPIPVPLGKAVGGTTVINSGTCFRAPAHVLALWERKFGLDGYDASTLEPYFERVERILHVKPVPWDVIGSNAKIFDRGVRALGLHGEPLRRNIEGCRGCGVCAFGCPSDAKQAMHLSYLPLAEQAGAVIYARCRAERLLVAGTRVVGIEAALLRRSPDNHAAGRLRVRAERVVLACGTVHTPLLLQRANLGQASGQLGKNLALHPAVGVTASFPEPLYHWRGTLQSYYVDHLHLSDGVMIEVTTVHPAMALSAAKAVGPELKDFLADLPFRASAGLFVSDTSHGEVRFFGPRGAPVIRYDLGRLDMARLLRGMALVGEIFFAAGATRVHTNLPGLESVTHPRDLQPLSSSPHWKPIDLHLAAFHPVGTCRMGPKPNTSVVGLDGKVHGTENLYVADGSLFPTCVGVNPQETIMAFATKIAEQICGRLVPAF